MAEASTTDESRRADLALAADIAERARGQWAAILVATAGMAGAFIFAFIGAYWIAGGFISFPLVMLVRALIGDAGRRWASGEAQLPDDDGAT